MFAGLLIVLIALAVAGAVAFGARGRGFTRRLRRELPAWVEAGLVAPEKAPLILERVAARSTRRHSVAAMFALLGAVLLGVGVLTFLAANWQAMPKFARLLVLFGAMWAAFAAAGVGVARGRGWLGESMLLLGVLLFGADIMLIAQIYHIDAHYPDGVLTWSLGALLTAWLMRSPAAFVAGLALAVLWSGMESFDFSRLHWPFLVVLAGYAWLAVRERWTRFARLLMAALMLWSIFAYGHFVDLSRADAVVYLTQLFFLVYLGLFVAGLHLELTERFAEWGETVRHYAAAAGLAALWALTFPDLLTARRLVDGAWVHRAGAGGGWIAATLLALALVAALALWHRRRTLARRAREPWHAAGLLILALILACIVANLFVPGSAAGIAAVAFNLLFFAAALWLVYAGAHLESRRLVNLGFLFFAAGLLARYFDLFWALLDRSLFFMAGGALLIAVAAALDRKRRRVVAGMGGGAS